MQEEIIEKCNEIRDLLVKKNESYGNAVFERGVLFDIEPVQAIKARINDKMNRIINQKSFEDENDIQDLTGYLILLQVAMEEKKEKWKDEIIGDCTELPESFKYVKG
jgi:hypothetical protein|tara:strand:- start:21742 stop:22062 length:321 start_codon:yes stop_codon:yes gene_type:complete